MKLAIATKQQRRKLSLRKEAKEIDRLRRSFERKLEASLKKYFVSTLRKIGKEYAAGQMDLSMRELDSPLEQIILPHYRAVFKAFGDRVLDRLELKFDYESIVRGYINERGGRNIRGISEYTKKQVNRVIEQSIKEGTGRAGAAKAIEALGVEFSRRRAAVIARTETHNASGYAHHEMHKQFMPVDTVKMWVATGDSRTRSFHAAAHGQEVGIDEPFNVNGKPMRYAGDWRGGAENVINCRCTIIYKAREDDVLDELPATDERVSDEPWVFKEGIKPKFEPGNMQIPVFGLGRRYKGDEDSLMLSLEIQGSYRSRAAVENGKRKGMQADEAGAAYLYTTSAYSKINDFFRGWIAGDKFVGNDPINKETKAEALGFRNKVKEGFEKLPPYVGQVHRGVSDRVEAMMSYYGIDKPGSVIRAESFWSSSFTAGAAFNKRLTFVINSKTGRQIDDLSNYETEKEVLFLPGAEFVVTKVDKDERGKTIVYMDEISSELKQDEIIKPVLIGGEKIISYSKRFLDKMYSQEATISVNGRLIRL